MVDKEGVGLGMVPYLFEAYCFPVWLKFSVGALPFLYACYHASLHHGCAVTRVGAAGWIKFPTWGRRTIYNLLED